MQSGDSVTGWFAALWHPRSSDRDLYTELPGQRERQAAARALRAQAELSVYGAFGVCSSAGPAGLALKEQPLQRTPAFNTGTAARHLENPSL